MTDWLKIREDYLNGGGSYRQLAKKYNVSFPTLRDRAMRERWKDAKEARRDKIISVTEQKVVNKIAETTSEIAAIQGRIRENIYSQIEVRMNAERLSNADFRRLVQCYRDMVDIDVEGNGSKDIEDITVLAELLRSDDDEDD